jgi:hypothetical protein
MVEISICGAIKYLTHSTHIITSFFSYLANYKMPLTLHVIYSILIWPHLPLNDVSCLILSNNIMQKLPLLQRTCRDTVMFEDELMFFYLLPVKNMTSCQNDDTSSQHQSKTWPPHSQIQVNTIEQLCSHSKLCLGGMSQNC